MCARTADAVLIEGRNILLIKRKNDPFKGFWALPGGFLEPGEDSKDACIRELFEEAGILGKIVKFTGTYSKPGRDPRGNTISDAYLVEVIDKRKEGAGDDAQDIEWFSLDDLPKLAFDHEEIIADARKLV